MSDKHVIKVPATSANLGPGFDCLGISLQLYNNVYISEADELSITIHGEGVDSIPVNKSNYMYAAYERTMTALGREIIPVHIEQHNAIPASRGLGSSGNAVVGGILCALAMSGERWGREEILNMATHLEGHPDNVAPAIYGGFTVSMMEDGKVSCIRMDVDDSICPVALIPGFELSTKQSRAVLPKSVGFKTAVYNSSHTAYLVAAMATRDYDQLFTAMKDKLHQPYRSQFIPLYDHIMQKCREDGVAAYLSGAGPTIMTLPKAGQTDIFKRSLEDMLGNGWAIVGMKPDNRGAYIE